MWKQASAIFPGVCWLVDIGLTHEVTTIVPSCFLAHKPPRQDTKPVTTVGFRVAPFLLLPKHRLHQEFVMERKKRQAYQASGYPNLQNFPRGKVLVGLGCLSLLVATGCKLPFTPGYALGGDIEVPTDEFMAHLPASDMAHLLDLDNGGTIGFRVEIMVSSQDMVVLLEDKAPHFIDILDQILRAHSADEFLPAEDLRDLEAQLLNALAEAYFDSEVVPYGDFYSLALAIEAVDLGVDVVGDTADTGFEIEH